MMKFSQVTGIMIKACGFQNSYDVELPNLCQKLLQEVFINETIAR